MSTQILCAGKFEIVVEKRVGFDLETQLSKDWQRGGKFKSINARRVERRCQEERESNNRDMQSMNCAFKDKELVASIA